MKEQEDKRRPVARKKIIGLPTTMNNGHSDFVGSVIGVVCVCMCVIFFFKNHSFKYIAPVSVSEVGISYFKDIFRSII